ncbi:SOUL family heme-binding protein [Natrononativus amylolyticus]|uniref:SOUL family heme-binding protein n=1 Tax=Natrononativus amylolyticus TaxID=2963434 RepID=UPI0020CC4080|nr:heme-binding protein [Natrononativus amylolyticus]
MRRHPYARWLAAAGTLLAAWIGWGLYVLATTPRVDYALVRTIDGVEIRRYPRLVLVETTADSDRTAFGRLYGYLTGANEGDEELPMTAPVRTHERSRPPGSAGWPGAGPDVTMGFFLPQEYDSEAAPEPEDETVTLTVEEPRTVAVRSFSWYATPERVERNTGALLEALEEHGLETAGEPFSLGYADPLTPPFLRRNEIAIELA